ncbi:MAG: TIGR02270 family protein [Gammaproteobacteria bacterium]|jgi:uncharacterized protein (TIGR02270 family)
MSNSTFALEICEEHVIDASFLWLYRDQGIRSPNYTARDVAEVDERIEAHLDGLRLAGEIGWQAAEENLRWDEPGEVFTGTAVAFSIGKKSMVDKVIEIGAGSVELARGAISGIAWIQDRDIAPFIRSFVQSKEPMVQRIGIGACAVLRKDMGEVLNQFLGHNDPIVCSRALKAAGELGRVDLLDECLAYMDDSNEEVKFWAAWSAALLGDLDSAEILKNMAQQGGKYSDRACDMAGRNMNLNDAQAWLQELGNKPENHRLAIILGSAIGMPVLITWLINMMTIPALARKAGEAFTNITGSDLVEMELAGDEPEGFEAGPTEDPADEFVELDEDEDLPWPDINKIAQWWATHKNAYDPHQRYLLGQPILKETLDQVLIHGKQTQRHAAALELALLSPGHPLIDVRARTNL